MNDQDLKKIGAEMVRALTPVYEQLDRMEKTLGSHSKTLDGHSKVLEGHSKILNEHTEKIDALTAEVFDLHQEFGANKDKTNSEIDIIKEHIGLTPTT